MPALRHEAPRLRCPAARHDDAGAHDHGEDPGDGLEWEDLMLEMNRASDPSNMIWRLVDRETGAVNGAIDWASPSATG